MRRLSLAFCALALLLTAGCDSDGTEASGSVRVMTQNLYLGGDLFTLLQPECEGNAIVGCVGRLYATIQASDPASRMAAIAAEIARVNPDLVGLQEVSTYYVQTPGDNLPGAAGTQATQVSFDFLDLLMAALEAEGASYVVASQSPNSDVEFPATANGTDFFDVRYTDSDVILRRSDVSTSNAFEKHFNSILTIPVGGVNQQFLRGYQRVDAVVDGFAFTFFNTHLEVGGQAETLQTAQSIELRSAVEAVAGPVVMVGDINSNGNANGPSYAVLTAPLTDAFAAGTAATCCQAPDLRNTTSSLATRIDVILTRGFDATAAGEVVLDMPADRVGGLWPSDHAGVWAQGGAGVDS